MARFQERLDAKVKGKKALSPGDKQEQKDMDSRFKFLMEKEESRRKLADALTEEPGPLKYFEWVFQFKAGSPDEVKRLEAAAADMNARWEEDLRKPEEQDSGVYAKLGTIKDVYGMFYPGVVGPGGVTIVVSTYKNNERDARKMVGILLAKAGVEIQ